MTDDRIREILVANGFKLSGENDSGQPDLKSYVYSAIRAIESEVLEEAAKVCDQSSLQPAIAKRIRGMKSNFSEQYKVDNNHKFRVVLEELIEFIDVPDKNCSCHVAPPCGDCVEYGGLRDAIKAAKALLAESKDQHFDDYAVDIFAQMMKDKLKFSREVKGRGGWNDPKQCSVESLNQMLFEHIEKGDPVDVANLCMMLKGYEAKIVRPAGKALEVPHPEKYALQSAPAKTVERPDAVELPPLPTPLSTVEAWVTQDYGRKTSNEILEANNEYYTTDQMREYALAALSQVRGKAQEPVAWTAAVEKAAQDAAYVFKDSCNHTAQAIDYMKATLHESAPQVEQSSDLIRKSLLFYADHGFEITVSKDRLAAKHLATGRFVHDCSNDDFDLLFNSMNATANILNGERRE